MALIDCLVGGVVLGCMGGVDVTVEADNGSKRLDVLSMLEIETRGIAEILLMLVGARMCVDSAVVVAVFVFDSVVVAASAVVSFVAVVDVEVVVAVVVSFDGNEKAVSVDCASSLAGAGSSFTAASVVAGVKTDDEEAEEEEGTTVSLDREDVEDDVATSVDNKIGFDANVVEEEDADEEDDEDDEGEEDDEDDDEDAEDEEEDDDEEDNDKAEGTGRVSCCVTGDESSL